MGFLPEDSKPETGGSTVYSTGVCAHVMVNLFVQHIHERKVPTTTIINLITMDINKWDVEKSPGCVFCTEMEYIQIKKEDYEEVKDENEVLL